jgi:type II pantothenate kinase
VIILGLDSGASFTKAVVMNGQKLLAQNLVESKKYSLAWLKSFSHYDRIVTKGNEFECLALGGLYLSKLKSAVVVGCGTGTAVVWARKNKPVVHLGGTGVGGGTIEGLGRLILGLNSAPEIFRLATKGNRTQVDLTVGDILGQGIDRLQPETTAANFAKLKSTKKADLAQALAGMVAETIGTVACLAAVKTPEKKIVFCGLVATNKLIRNYLAGICRLYNLKPVFPKNATYATAIGTVLNTNPKKQTRASNR